MRININGYFVSEGMPWEDWQSGHKFEGVNYDFLFFRKDGKFFMHSAKQKEINIEVFKDKKNYGEYKMNDNTIEVLYNPNSQFPVEIIFTILSSETLLDKNLIEYHYVEVDKVF